MNEPGTPDNVDRREPMSGFAKFFFVAWIAATMLVYFVAFGTRFIVSLFGRLGLDRLGEGLQWLSDGLMTWFSTRGC
jgi:hypothetical protein